jgi:hypothetical protein
MEPFTASNIKVRPKNVIKDFVHVAGALNVSHMCMFTKTTVGPYFKVNTFLQKKDGMVNTFLGLSSPLY